MVPQAQKTREKGEIKCPFSLTSLLAKVQWNPLEFTRLATSADNLSICLIIGKLHLQGFVFSYNVESPETVPEEGVPVRLDKMTVHSHGFIMWDLTITQHAWVILYLVLSHLLPRIFVTKQRDVPILHIPPKCHTVPGSPLRSTVILTFQPFRIIENRYGHLQVKCLVSKRLCVLA